MPGLALVATGRTADFNMCFRQLLHNRCDVEAEAGDIQLNLDQEEQRSRLHQEAVRPSSPDRDQIEDFFDKYPQFDYQRDQPSSQEFYRMCDFFEWERDDEERKQAHEDFKTALVHQFNGIYGVGLHDMEPWRRLYRALDLDPLPDEVRTAQSVSRNVYTSCEASLSGGQVVKRLFVNLVDLVDTRRTGEPVTKFKSLSELQEYTISSGKYFPRDSAYAGGVLKYLLREILTGRGSLLGRH